MRYVTIEIPVRLWQRVDGCADNSMAIDVMGGLMDTVIAGSCVRDAGWRASASHEGELDKSGWPPRDHPLAITLRHEHWEWVVAQLDRWEPFVSDGAADDADVRAMISAELTSG